MYVAPTEKTWCKEKAGTIFATATDVVRFTCCHRTHLCDSHTAVTVRLRSSFDGKSRDYANSGVNHGHGLDELLDTIGGVHPATAMVAGSTASLTTGEIIQKMEGG